MHVALARPAGLFQHGREQQVRRVGRILRAGMRAEHIGAEFFRRVVQQQAGGKAAILIPGVEQAQRAVRFSQSLGSTGVQFAYMRGQRPGLFPVRAPHKLRPEPPMGRSELAALLHPQRGSRAAQHAAQPGRGLGPRRKQIITVAIDNMRMQTRRQIRPHGPAAHGPAFLQGFVQGRLKGRVAVFAAQGIGHGHEPVLGGPKKIRPHTKGRTPRHGPHERQGMLRHAGQGVDTGKKFGFHTVTKNVFPSSVSGVASPFCLSQEAFCLLARKGACAGQG